MLLGGRPPGSPLLHPAPSGPCPESPTLLGGHSWLNNYLPVPAIGNCKLASRPVHRTDVPARPRKVAWSCSQLDSPGSLRPRPSPPAAPSGPQ